MFTILLLLHILVAVLLVIAILLQTGQGGTLSGAFGGGGGNQTLFGGRGAATFLTRATTYLGAGFLLISLVLAYVQAHQTAPQRAARNIIQENLPRTPAAQPPAGEGGGTPTPEAPTGSPLQVPPAGGAGGSGGGQ